MKANTRTLRPFFTFAAALVLGLGGLSVAAPGAQAGQEHYYQSQHRQQRHHHQAAVYLATTVEVSRHRTYTIQYNHCGHAYRVYYTVITYRDIYSNGTEKTYSVTVYG